MEIGVEVCVRLKYGLVCSPLLGRTGFNRGVYVDRASIIFKYLLLHLVSNGNY